MVSSDVMLTPISKGFVVLAVEDHLVANRTGASPRVTGDNLMAAREVDNPFTHVNPERFAIDRRRQKVRRRDLLDRRFLPVTAHRGGKLRIAHHGSFIC